MSDNIQNIPTVIFCGGKGTRLMEETEFKPKPMVAVGGMPIVLHIMKIYAHFGFKKFILCLGYKGQMIKEYFSNPEFASSGLEIILADTGEETLTGERLLMVSKYLNGDEFMVTYGDGVSDINIKALVAFHRKQGTIGTIAGVHPYSKYGLVKIDNKKNLVKGFAQKPLLYDYVSGGFMIFNRQAFDYLDTGPMEDGLIKLATKKQLSIY